MSLKMVNLRVHDLAVKVEIVVEELRKMKDSKEEGKKRKAESRHREGSAARQ